MDSLECPVDLRRNEPPTTIDQVHWTGHSVISISNHWSLAFSRLKQHKIRLHGPCAGHLTSGCYPEQDSPTSMPQSCVCSWGWDSHKEQKRRFPLIFTPSYYCDLFISVDNALKWVWTFLQKYDLHPTFGVNELRLHVCVCLLPLAIVAFHSAEITSIFMSQSSVHDLFWFQFNCLRAPALGLQSPIPSCTMRTKEVSSSQEKSPWRKGDLCMENWRASALV